VKYSVFVFDSSPIFLELELRHGLELSDLELELGLGNSGLENNSL